MRFRIDGRRTSRRRSRDARRRKASARCRIVCFANRERANRPRRYGSGKIDPTGARGGFIAAAAIANGNLGIDVGLRRSRLARLHVDARPADLKLRIARIQGHARTPAELPEHALRDGEIVPRDDIQICRRRSIGSGHFVGLGAFAAIEDLPRRLCSCALREIRNAVDVTITKTVRIICSYHDIDVDEGRRSAGSTSKYEPPFATHRAPHAAHSTH